jgi:hydroxymethylbilane synthase
MLPPLRIGTRGSRLALWQAGHVADSLRPLVSPRVVEIVEIQTSGDQVRDLPLAQIGGEGVFTKEIQRAVLAGAADIAVHSLKDLPTLPVEGLILAAVPRRGATGDVFVSVRHASFAGVPAGAILATGSMRRRAQVLHRRPDLKLANIRGNVETRLRKLQEENLDGLILAQAGLQRLGLEESVTEVLDASWMLPAVGQGALGLECRHDDEQTIAFLEKLNDAATNQAVSAERALLRALGGGCQVPVGVEARAAGNVLSLRAAVLDPAGKTRIEANHSGPAQQAEKIGNELARELLARGAGKLLNP